MMIYVVTVLLSVDLLRKERDHMQQKAEGVKSAVLTAQNEFKKEKDEFLRQLHHQKREIQRLEAALVEKDKSLERMQALGASKHKEEIAHILQHSHEVAKSRESSTWFAGLMETQATNVVSKALASHTIREDETGFAQRALAFEKSKLHDIALIKEQYECILARKKTALDDMTKEWHERNAAMQHVRTKSNEKKTHDPSRSSYGYIYIYICILSI
jgi:hypothetical protein